MNLHEIANSGSYGTGKKARDKLAEKAARRAAVPERIMMNYLLVQHEPDALVASFGYDVEEDRDFHLNSDFYAAIGDTPLAGREARAIAALWNAYRDGDLVWKDEL